MKISLFIFFILNVLIAKRVKKNIILSRNNNSSFLTKFGISIGMGKLNVRIKYKDPNEKFERTFNINAYMDYEWKDSLQLSKCIDKERIARITESYYVNELYKYDYEKEFTINQEASPHLWFVSITDCNEPVREEIPELEIFFHFTGVDGTEFSHEELGVFQFLYIIFIFLFICTIYVYKKYKNEAHKMDMKIRPSLFILVACFMELLSIFFELVNYFSYNNDGIGIPYFRTIGIIFEISSQYLVTSLIFMLSLGWTIKFSNLNEAKKYFPLMIVLFITHICLAGMTYIGNENDDKFHDYESIQGLLLIFIKFSIFAYNLFISGNLKSKCSPNQIKFIQWFEKPSGLYLISFPLVIIIGMFFVPYMRFTIVKFGNLFTQVISIIFMASILITKSDYYKISDKVRSYLPGIKDN